ncbi:MAG: hypothetical protein FWD61_11970, partial [Phycisphaerales bacterium]|nr:hypothetical protein [Phycisphaerales bacterium]
MSYRIDETSKLVLDRMREQAESAARVQSSNVADNYSAPQQFVVGRLVGMATITDVGEDDDSVHWAWEFALRDHDTGKFVACGQGSDLYGECVIADGGVGAIGINGLLYVQQNDDDGTTLILVPISAGFQGRITSVSGSFPVWNYTVQRVTKYDPSQTGPEAWVTDGKNITGVLNRFEWTPASYPYWHGAGV